MNLNDFANDCLEISKRRTDLEESSVLDYLKHYSGEVLEAVDAYNNYQLALIFSENEDSLKEIKDDFSLELADIIICVLLCCAKEGIDIEKALQDAMEKNKKNKRT